MSNRSRGQVERKSNKGKQSVKKGSAVDRQDSCSRNGKRLCKDGIADQSPGVCEVVLCEMLVSALLLGHGCDLE